jgi:hypothetical protein
MDHRLYLVQCNLSFIKFFLFILPLVQVSQLELYMSFVSDKTARNARFSYEINEQRLETSNILGSSLET